MKTWHAENAAVACFLASVWALTGMRPVEVVGACAVMCGFCCASISDRMIEREAARSRPIVKCYRTFWWYFWVKELLFAGYFALGGNWSALAGCVVFSAYPLWRRFWRHVHPMQEERSHVDEGQVRS